MEKTIIKHMNVDIKQIAKSCGKEFLTTTLRHLEILFGWWDSITSWDVLQDGYFLAFDWLSLYPPWSLWSSNRGLRLYLGEKLFFFFFFFIWQHCILWGITDIYYHNLYKYETYRVIYCYELICISVWCWAQLVSLVFSLLIIYIIPWKLWITNCHPK